MVKIVCLMPLFNHVDTLEKSVLSVLNQNGDFDLKVVILDDYSTDGSYEIALKLQEKFKDQIYVHRNDHNVRLLVSMYNGYNYLVGSDYFCVLDPDDWYTDDTKLSRASTFLEEHKDYSMYMNNVLVHKETSDEPYLKFDTDVDTIDFSYDDYINRNFTPFVQTSGVLYKNVYFKNEYNKDFKRIFDYSFPESFRADGFRFCWYLKSGKARFENKICSVYNYNDAGIWASQSEMSQVITNAKSCIAFSEFFVDDSEFYKENCMNLLLSLNSSKDKLDNLSDKDKLTLKRILALLQIASKHALSNFTDRMYIKFLSFIRAFCIGQKKSDLKTKIKKLKQEVQLALLLK